MSLESEFTLSFYKEVAVINEKHQVSLVQHVESRKLYVKKTVSPHNLEIYQTLKREHFASIPAIIWVMSLTPWPAIMIQPTPSVAQTISAASMVIQELDRATWAPEKMDGTAEGTTISKNTVSYLRPASLQLRSAVYPHVPLPHRRSG